jgi:hypothetical protein
MPASEVQEDDVEAKAVTNFYYRCLCAVLGIKGLTWKDLQPLGIRPDGAAARITYGDAKPKTTTPTNGQSATAGAGNCPTCHKGNLQKRAKKSDGSIFYACDNSKKNPSTGKYEGCRHMQDDPPAAAPPAASQPEPEPTTTPPDAADKSALVTDLMAFMREKRDMGPTGVWNDMSAYLSRVVKSPADVTAEEIENYQQQQKELLDAGG